MLRSIPWGKTGTRGEICRNSNSHFFPCFYWEFKGKLMNSWSQQQLHQFDSRYPIFLSNSLIKPKLTIIIINWWSHTKLTIIFITVFYYHIMICVWIICVWIICFCLTLILISLRLAFDSDLECSSCCVRNWIRNDELLRNDGVHELRL